MRPLPPARVAGRKFRKGVVLHAETEPWRVDKEIVALPLSAVWTR